MDGLVIKARFFFKPQYCSMFIDSEHGEQLVLEVDYPSLAEVRDDFNLYLPYLDKENCRMLVLNLPGEQDIRSPFE